MVNAPMPKSRTKVAWGSISASEGSDQNLDSLMSQWGVKLLGIYDVLEKTLLSGEFFSWNHNPIGRWNFGTWRSSHCRCSVVLKHCRSQRRMNAVVVDHNSNVSHISMCTTFDAFFPVDPHVSPRKKKKNMFNDFSMVHPWFTHHYLGFLPCHCVLPAFCTWPMLSLAGICSGVTWKADPQDGWWTTNFSSWIVIIPNLLDSTTLF